MTVTETRLICAKSVSLERDGSVLRYQEFMARRPRRELPDGVYHATARGTNRTAIVLDVLDCEAFISLLARVTQRWRWSVVAFCLMPNHYHLVLETTVEFLSKGMHALNGRHARRFNERHGRGGHLFQERFDAFVIETDAHLERAASYVLANPVRAGLCTSVEEWPWSGTSQPGGGSVRPTAATSRT